MRCRKGCRRVYILFWFSAIMNARQHNTHHHTLRRRTSTEDVDYWRKRAGWFDDDQAMKDYNDAINEMYSEFYQPDIDRSYARSGGFSGAVNPDLVENIIKVLAVVVAICLCFLMLYILINRGLGTEKEKKKRAPTSSRSVANRSEEVI